MREFLQSILEITSFKVHIVNMLGNLNCFANLSTDLVRRILGDNRCGAEQNLGVCFMLVFRNS